MEGAGGEEAMGKLVQRFRAAFVDALQPQFLPPFWHVDHRYVQALSACFLDALRSHLDDLLVDLIYKSDIIRHTRIHSCE